MTRQEAIELLVNATYSEEWQGNEKLTKAQHMAIKALEKEPKWVPVTKALPTKGVKVLVQSSYPNLTYVAEIGSFLSQPEGWRTADGYERIEQTVAWMPLPKPYEETEQ